MDDFFSSVAREFGVRSAQIRQFVKSHGPSIGAGHEVLLRSFLRDYLPRWVSVGHGFIRDHEGTISGQTDILLYNSLYYAPLYRIDDFIIVQPESVVACIEVKTNVTKRDFVRAMDRMSLIKRMAERAQVGMFIFHPPSLQVIKKHLDSCDFTQAPVEAIPDFICGLSKFFLEKGDVVLRDQSEAGSGPPTAEGIAYLDHVYATRRSGQDYTFEVFFYQMYRHLEARVNRDLKDGIDNVWEVRSEDNAHVVRPHGRLRFSNVSLKDIRLVSWMKKRDKAESQPADKEQQGA